MIRIKTFAVTAPILLTLALGTSGCFKKRQDPGSATGTGAAGPGTQSSIADARKFGAEISQGDTRQSFSQQQLQLQQQQQKNGAADAKTGKGGGSPAAGGAVAGAAGSGVSLSGGALPGVSLPAGGVSVPGVSSSSSTTTGGGGPTVTPTEKAPAPVEQCYTVIFHHKQTAGHTNEEACSHHKNVIKLKQELQFAKLNPKTLCVRVNGTPVAYQVNKKKSDELVIGPIAGPNAKITARFCTGKAKCAEDCTIPKDEFMDAIGGGDDSNDSGKLGEWGTETAEKEADVNSHLDAQVKKELENVETTYVFHDWISEPETPACNGAKVARAE